MHSHSVPSPGWPDRIRQLLADMKLTQAGLAERLGVSPATVSRWLQGTHEPTAQAYVALGNLARKPDSLYFWERAGMNVANLPESGSKGALTSLRVELQDLRAVAGTKASRKLSGKTNAVAIPLLAITAYGDRIPPKENTSILDAEVQDVLLAPLTWCPHPENMISMHLAGDSMMPVIAPGSVIFVDTAVTDRTGLNRKLAVVSHRDLGFKVARFQRVQNSDLLMSANHRYSPLDVSNTSKWKIFGEVLWWVSRDPVAEVTEGQDSSARSTEVPSRRR